MRSRTKKRNVTVELPEELLRQAQHASGQGITETIREGLQILSARHAYAARLCGAAAIPRPSEVPAFRAGIESRPMIAPKPGFAAQPHFFKAKPIRNFPAEAGVCEPE